jgi:signal transduction histidine kinase
MSITDLLDWFAGGRQRYMTLDHCMHHDVLWITLTVLLDAAVVVGCLVIARHWRRNEATLPPSPPRKALHNMKNIFMFCGLCGYLFIPVEMFWPAWRLYDLFLLFLVYYTWRHALGARDLRVIYAELGRSAMLERDLKEAREEARRKGFFLNAVSHDLKTPLHGLMLQAELAELSLASDDPSALRESLAEIQGCARAMADLLNRFLEIARLDRTDEPSQIRLVDLGELFREVAGQAHAAAEQKGLRLAASAPNEVSIPSDRVKLERILLNLVDNAIKFTHDGSVELGADIGSSGVAISVTDTGEGIAPEHQARIFEAFIQVHNRERDSRKGFGLGLAIASRLARQIGGEIEVESQVGRGSRFTLLLPAAPSPGRGGDGGPGRPCPARAGEAAPALG